MASSRALLLRHRRGDHECSPLCARYSNAIGRDASFRPASPFKQETAVARNRTPDGRVGSPAVAIDVCSLTPRPSTGRKTNLAWVLPASDYAIGDAVIGQLITAYEKALAVHPDQDRRHRIEHCGFPTPEQHERMKRAGLYPCPQQVFIHDFGDAYISVLGGERALSSYPLKTWKDLGFKPATGSDSPVCHPNPYPNIYSMLTRKTGKGTVMDARERVSTEEELQVYTEYGAFSQKLEKVKGRLIPGQVDDIAVSSARKEDVHSTVDKLAMTWSRLSSRRMAASDRPRRSLSISRERSTSVRKSAIR